MTWSQPSVVSHKSLYFDCHSERSEESRLFKYMRPFTEFTLRLFTSFRVTDEGFRVTRKNLFQHPANVKKRWTHYTSFFVTDAPERFIKVGQRFLDRKSTRLNSSHSSISYAVFCLKK